MQKRLTFKKTALRRLAGGNITKQFEYVKYRAVNGGRAKTGWCADFSPPAELEIKPTVPLDENGEEFKSTYSYTVNLAVGCRSKRERRDDVVLGELDHIVKMVQTAANGKGWQLLSVEDLPKDHVFSEDSRKVIRPEKKVVVLEDDSCEVVSSVEAPQELVAAV